MPKSDRLVHVFEKCFPAETMLNCLQMLSADNKSPLARKELCRVYSISCNFLFFSAMDDIPHADQTRTLIKDIWDIRISKLRSSIDTFVKSEATHAKVRFLCT